MSERIKRYTAFYADAFGVISLLEHKSGEFALSIDVAEIEAENARLRRIVEAGDKIQLAIHERGSSVRLRELSRAYDAAKAHATQQGEKTKE